MPDVLIAAHAQVPTQAVPASGALDWSQVGVEHAMLVARGAIDDAVLVDFPHRIAALVDTGVRFLVADLSQVSTCSPGLVAALAQACRALQRYDGWLRSVATAACVSAALEEAEVTDVFAVYQASIGTPGR